MISFGRKKRYDKTLYKEPKPQTVQDPVDKVVVSDMKLMSMRTKLLPPTKGE